MYDEFQVHRDPSTNNVVFNRVNVEDAPTIDPPPRTPFLGTWLLIPYKDILAVRNGKSRIFLLARIEYSDVFAGTPRYTDETCWELKVQVALDGVNAKNVTIFSRSAMASATS